MKYYETNLDRLQHSASSNTCIACQCHLPSQDQHPVHTVHPPVPRQPVHNEHRPVPARRMNPQENLAQQNKVHEVMNQKDNALPRPPCFDQ